MGIKVAPRESGFTLVELVMVIILIGVLSALGVGLFARSSAFSPLLAAQQLESATLLAQQAALAGNTTTTNTINNNPNHSNTATTHTHHHHHQHRQCLTHR